MDTFATLLIIAVSAALVNNVVLSQFLGLCSFLGISKKIDTSVGMGGAVMLVLVVASAASSLIYQFVLVPFNLTYLKTIVFIIVIASLVQFLEMYLKKTNPKLYEALGVFLALITTNCAVLGVCIDNVNRNHDFISSIVYGFGTAIGFFIAIVIIASIREKCENNDIPESFKGLPHVLLTSCLMAIAFMGFNGVLPRAL